MNNNILVSEDLKEVTLTIKFPIDELLDRFSQMFYHKLNQSNHKIMDAINDSDETLSRLEVCELLKVSQSTLSKLIKEKRIPYLRPGQKLIFLRNEVLQAIKTNGGSKK